MKLSYGATVFLSAFLLFQVQPLIARYILPWFGGTSSVWTTCMLFFQVVLLAGYGYVHASTSRLGARAQAHLHIGLLLISLVFLPIVPSADWKPTSDDEPVLRILALLAATVGVPYLVVSTTGPLLQRWFYWTHPGRSPYRLFALSNLGSLLALLSYPVAFEPFLRLRTQSITWSVGYGIFVVGCVACAWSAGRASAGQIASPSAEAMPDPGERDSGGAKPPRAGFLLWVLLAAAPSALLLAATNELCQEVAAIPFLWVVPLSLYLVSFILTFESDRWYRRGVWISASIVVSIVVPCVLVDVLHRAVWEPALALCGLVICGCMCCHGELSRSRPPPAGLTRFYLAVSIGGALGGVFVAVVAPLVFDDFSELPVAILASLVLSLEAWRRDRRGALHGPRKRLVRSAAAMSLVGVAAVVLTEHWLSFDLSLSSDPRVLVEQHRSFYGVLTVEEETDELGTFRRLRHGRILHGLQYLDGELRAQPTGYYGDDTGVGLAIRRHPARLRENASALRIGVVGLGVGTIAVHGKEGDELRFYEIHPHVVRIARERFSYLADCRARVDIVLGDARLEIERELESGNLPRLDVLAIDAFSSDSIPMHLATRECYELYWRRLADDGILAFHISNRYLDLRPVLHTLASESDHRAVTIDWDNPARGSPGYDPRQSGSRWILITRNHGFLDDDEVAGRVASWPESARFPLVWTDDFSSLWQVLKEK